MSLSSKTDFSDLLLHCLLYTSLEEMLRVVAAHHAGGDNIVDRVGVPCVGCDVGIGVGSLWACLLYTSLTTLLPLALGFSPHLPVSVCGTGTLA